jgi:hypothetical protein
LPKWIVAELILFMDVPGSLTNVRVGRRKTTEIEI